MYAARRMAHFSNEAHISSWLWDLCFNQSWCTTRRQDVAVLKTHLFRQTYATADRYVIALDTTITDCTQPLQQRRKTSEQNAFFAQEWRSVSRCQRVKIGLHWFDNNRSPSRNQWNLLLWLASATTGTACCMPGLWRVQKKCPSVQITLFYKVV